MTRLERVNKQIAKTKSAIAEHQESLKELERQRSDIEDKDLIQRIRNLKLSNEEIEAMLQAREKEDESYNDSQISSLTSEFNEGRFLEFENQEH